MSLADHLAELRTRLVKCSLAVLVLGVASLMFAKPIFGLLMQPVLQALPADQRALVYTSGIEEINVLMKVGVYCGVFLTTPVLLWQLWGFVSPGLYPQERKLAAPFVVAGTLAFVGGLVFCYLVVLPPMFQFLLREGDSAALEDRLDAGRLAEEDALRFVRLGELGRAARAAGAATGAMSASGEGSTAGGLTGSLAPEALVQTRAQLDGFGRLVDAFSAGLPPAARPRLLLVMEKRVAAVEAHGRGEFARATEALDAGAALLGGAAGQGEEVAALWRMEKELASGVARYEAQRWTRPMLTMREQLSLVLLLLLAFGIIFELPLVMAVLGSVGLVNSRFLFKYQRHAFVVCLIAAAVITPTGDVVNLSLMAGPMLLCYELGVLAVWLIERRKARASAITPTAG